MTQIQARQASRHSIDGCLFRRTLCDLCGRWRHRFFQAVNGLPGITVRVSRTRLHPPQVGDRQTVC